VVGRELQRRQAGVVEVRGAARVVLACGGDVEAAAREEEEVLEVDVALALALGDLDLRAGGGASP